MALTASKLRENVYKLLDEVANTGHPIDINRKGKRLRIISMETTSKLSRLKKHDTIKEEDLDSIIHMDWSSEWNPIL